MNDKVISSPKQIEQIKTDLIYIGDAKVMPVVAKLPLIVSGEHVPLSYELALHVANDNNNIIVRLSKLQMINLQKELNKVVHDYERELEWLNSTRSNKTPPDVSNGGLL